VCWPLRGGRGTPYTQKPLKTYRKKIIISHRGVFNKKLEKSVENIKPSDIH
jgi:hypothetical protein